MTKCQAVFPGTEIECSLPKDHTSAHLYKDPEPEINQSSQPDPEVNTNTPVVERVIAFLDERAALGEQKYGTRLQPHNGRDALRDAFEEAVDLVMYLAQVIIERDDIL